MKVRIIVIEGGANRSPIIKPIMPVPRNIIIKTFNLFGSMYLILIKGIKIVDYYKLTLNTQFSQFCLRKQMCFVPRLPSLQIT